MFIINPGTEAKADATLEQAERIVDQICADLEIPREAITRNPNADGDGFFGFKHEKFEIEVPGDDPETFLSSTPWVSRRMYVDGSSWLYKYGFGFMRRAITGEDD